MKYYGAGYGAGSTKFGRKIISFSGWLDKDRRTAGFTIGKSESIILDVYDYGITFGFLGFYLSIGWFIAECGTWKEEEL